MLLEPLVDAKLHLCNGTNEQRARRILEDLVSGSIHRAWIYRAPLARRAL